MKIDMNNRLVDLLRSRKGQMFTARELAIMFVQAYPDDCSRKKAESSNLETDEDLIAQITAEVGARRPSVAARSKT